MQRKTFYTLFLILTILIVYAANLPFRTEQSKIPEPKNVSQPQNLTGSYFVAKSIPLRISSHLSEVIEDSPNTYAYSLREIYRLENDRWNMIYFSADRDIGYADFAGNMMVLSFERKDEFGSNTLLSDISLFRFDQNGKPDLLADLTAPLSEGIHQIAFISEKQILVYGLNELVIINIRNSRMYAGSKIPLLIHPSNDLRMVKRSFRTDRLFFGKDGVYKILVSDTGAVLNQIFSFSDKVVVPGKYTYPYKRYLFDGDNNFFIALRDQKLHVIIRDENSYTEITADTLITDKNTSLPAVEITQLRSDRKGNVYAVTPKGILYKFSFDKINKCISARQIKYDGASPVMFMSIKYDSSLIVFTSGYSQFLRFSDKRSSIINRAFGNMIFQYKEYYLTRGSLYGIGVGRLTGKGEQVYVTDIFDVNKLFFGLTANPYSNYLQNNAVERGLDGQLNNTSEIDGRTFDLGVSIGDVDESGSEDLILTRLAGSNSLYLNNGYGYFRDVTKDFGLDTNMFRSESVVQADVNNDGYIDIFMTSYLSTNRLFISKTGTGFYDATEQMGLKSNWGAVSAAFCDINNDGWDDLYICNWLPGNKLYLNNKGTGFIDITNSAGVSCGTGKRCNSAVFSDFDNDGDFDLLVGSRNDNPDLFENTDGLHFRNISVPSGLIDTLVTYGAAARDINNDGFTDIIISDLGGLKFYLNSTVSQVKFTDITDSSYADENKSNSVITGVSSIDLFDDGYPDFLTAQSAGYLHSYINILSGSASESRFVKITVEGTISNRSAIGAVIRLYDGTKIIGLNRVDGGSGYAGISSKSLIFGLPSATGKLRMEVFFPASGITRSIKVRPGEIIFLSETEGIQLFLNRAYKKAEQFFVSGTASDLLLRLLISETAGFFILFVFINRKRLGFGQFLRGLQLRTKILLLSMPPVLYLSGHVLFNLIFFIFPDNQGWVDGRDWNGQIAIVSLLLSGAGIFLYLNRYHGHARELENFESGVKKLESLLSMFRHGESCMMNLNRISLYLNNISEGEILDKDVAKRFQISLKDYDDNTSNDLFEIIIELTKLSEFKCCNTEISNMKSILIKLTSAFNNLSERLKDISELRADGRAVKTDLAVKLHFIHENVSMIKEAVYSLSELCFNFLYSDPGSVLTSLVRHYGENNSAIQIIYDAPVKPVYIRIPKNKMEKVLSILTENAIQAFPPGAMNPEIRFIVNCSAESLFIIVKDNGPGIPENIMKSLYKKGTTGKKGGHGTGLYMTVGILDEYGAKITCNTDQSGTEFILEFRAAGVRTLN